MDPLADPDPYPSRELDVPALTHRTADLLRDHVPLSLLIDLVDERGPRSEVVYTAEGGDAAWLTP